MRFFRWDFALFIVVLGTGLSCSGAAAEEELFEQVFGRTPEKRQTIVAPLIVDHQAREEIQITLADKPDEIRVAVAPIGAALRGSVQVAVLDRLNTSADSQGRITLKDLRELGLPTVWDEQSVELRVEISPQARLPSQIRLLGRDLPEKAASALKPSVFSTYVNLRSGFDLIEQSAIEKDEGLQPFHGEIEGAINYKDWVLEGATAYQGNNENQWQRGDLRVVHDDPDRMIRYSFGDLSYPISGFQSFLPMGGITVAKNFALDPYRITEPRGSTSFLLKSPSRVEVIVNGRSVQTLQLPAGPHNLREFLFASGGNDVVLKITDEVGKVETIELSFFFDARLLAPGESEFSYSIGFPSEVVDGGKSYDTSHPILSLFNRLGVSETLTAGLNSQLGNSQQLLGGEAVWATPIGTFQPDLAGSHDDHFDLGYASRLMYRYYNAASEVGNSWNCSIQYRSPKFVTPGICQPSDTEWDFSGRYSQRLLWNSHGGIGGSYQIARNGRGDSSGVNVFLSKRFGRSWLADVTLDRRDAVNRNTEYRAFVSLTYLFPDRRQSVRGSYDTFTGTSRANYHFRSQDYVGGYEGDVGVQQHDGDYNVEGGLRYVGQRAEASLVHDAATPMNRGDSLENRTSFRVGTALVFADGIFGISRPVYDSFAVVVPHPAWEHQKIGVDPLQETYSAKVDRFGPAVLPDLTSYHVRSVAVDTPDLPDGFELGPPSFTVWPRYKSGTVVVVGSELSVQLVGTLQSSDGLPVALQTGELVSLQKTTNSPIEFFTNRSGKFSIDGGKFGKWQLRVTSGNFQPVEIEIPKDKVGSYSIGILKLLPATP